VEDEVSTYLTDNECDTTRSWVLTIPGTQDTTRDEFRFRKWVEPTYTQETRTATNTYTPGTDAVTTPAIWQNFSPNEENKPFTGPPDWPTDPRGTWQHMDKPIPPGQAGPDGVYQNGEGNGSWFYRRAAQETQAATAGSWSGWSGPVDTNDGWGPAGPEVPPVILGSAAQPGGNVLNHEQSRMVVDQDGHWLYYVLGAEASTDEAAASWLLEEQVPGQPWKQFDERTVSNEDGTPEEVTYYAWSDNKPCEVTPTPNPEPTVLGTEQEAPAAKKPAAKKPAAKQPVPTAVDAGIGPEKTALPDTGGPEWTQVLLGLALVTGGGAAFVASRRRESA
jgi:LPXTG-motif cell wall-anchored protein